MRGLVLPATALLLALSAADPAMADKRLSTTAPAAKPKEASPEALAYAAKKKAWSDRLKASKTTEERAAVLEEMRKDQPAQPPKRVLSEDERRNHERAEEARRRAKEELVRSKAKPKPARAVQEREKRSSN